jgi:glycine/D-amino acid oxidase-like deaminating enzyme
MKRFVRRQKQLGRHLIIGAGPAGLWTARQLALHKHELGMAKDIFVFDGGAIGGGNHDSVSVSRCQMWQHSGPLFSISDGQACHDLQQAKAMLTAASPQSRTEPISLIVEPAGRSVKLADCLDAAGIPYRAIERDILPCWYPALKLAPRVGAIYRTSEAVIDLRRLSFDLARQASSLGVRFVQRQVTRLVRKGDRITELRLQSGGRILVGADDVVILCASSTIRPLLATADAELPGLTVVQSHLIAAPGPELPLIAIAGGGPTCVPQPFSNISVYGNSGRLTLPPDTDRQPLVVDRDEIERVRREVRAWLGIKLPTDALAWAGRKAEYLPPGRQRSQSMHIERHPELHQLRVVLPGKMSLAPLAGERAAQLILRDEIDRSIAQSIWEQWPAASPIARDEITYRLTAPPLPTVKAAPASVAKG